MLVMPKYYERIASSDMLADLLTPYSKFSNEHFILVLMNRDLTVQQIIDFAQGTIDRCEVKIGELAKTILNSGCKGFAVSHNHPNGTLIPSEFDNTLTAHIAVMADCIGVQCLDHIITTPDGLYYSYCEEKSKFFTKEFVSNVFLVAEAD